MPHTAGPGAVYIFKHNMHTMQSLCICGEEEALRYVHRMAASCAAVRPATDGMLAVWVAIGLCAFLDRDKLKNRSSHHTSVPHAKHAHTESCDKQMSCMASYNLVCMHALHVMPGSLSSFLGARAALCVLHPSWRQMCA